MALIKCPDCNNEVQNESGTCPICGHPFQKATSQTINVNLRKCTDCGNLISKSAISCPHCGSKVIKKKAGSNVLEILCFVGIIFAFLLSLMGAAIVAYVITLFWLIVYQLQVEKYQKDLSFDISDIKKTRNAVLVVLLLQSITFVFKIQ